MRVEQRMARWRALNRARWGPRASSLAAQDGSKWSPGAGHEGKATSVWRDRGSPAEVARGEGKAM